MDRDIDAGSLTNWDLARYLDEWAGEAKTTRLRRELLHQSAMRLRWPDQYRRHETEAEVD